MIYDMANTLGRPDEGTRVINSILNIHESQAKEISEKENISIDEARQIAWGMLFGATRGLMEGPTLNI